MARKKKKGLQLGGLDFNFSFNNPELQRAYEKWFIDMPLRAPVEVEYYDPTETATGTVKRSPINTRMDPYEVMRGELMAKHKYGYESGSGAIFKQNPIVKRQTSRGSTAGTKLGKATRRAVGKGGMDLIAGRDRTNERIKALGGKPVGQDTGESIWNRVFDVLLRGNYASAEGVRSASKNAEKEDASFLGQLEAFGKGAVAGATGKKKTTFGKVFDVRDEVASGLQWLAGGEDAPKWAKKSAKKGGAAVQTLLATGADIGADPTTYTGLGLVGKGGKAVQKSLKAVEHLQEGAKIASRGKKTIKTFDDEATELLAGKRYISGRMRHSEEALIHKPLLDMKASIKNTRFKEIRNDLRVTDEYADLFDRGGVRNPASLAAANKKLNAAAKEAAEKEADAWMVAAIKNYQDVVATNIEKGIGIGIAGKHGKKFTIVPAPVLSHTLGSVKNIDVVDRGLKAASKYFQASAGVSPELHNLRLQATNSGMSRAEVMGNRLRAGFSGMHRDVREATWENALKRNNHSGETITVDGIQQDAAKFLNEEIDKLEHVVTGTTTGNVPMSAKELNAFLPPGFKGKFKNGIPGVADPRKSLQSWELRDGPRALWVAQQAYERANTMRSMYVSAAEAFGVRTTGQSALKNATAIFSDLQSRGWREVSEKKTHGLMKGVLFDDETAKGLEKMIDLMNNERNWNIFLRKLARITAPIKFYLTVPNPGYHIRNSLGDAFINELDNVSVNSYAQSFQVLHKSAEKYGGVNPLIMEEGNLLEKAFARKNQEVVFHTKTPLRKPNGAKSTAVTDAEIYAGMNQYGITQNFTLTEFANLSDNPNLVQAFGGKVKSWMINKSEMRENYFRLAHFIELVKKNPSGARTLDETMAYAAARIRKTHFDYTDFTRFEKQVASNVIPFYKWTRKAVPLMMEVMFTNPGKAILPSKAQLNLSMMSGNDPLAEDPFPDLAGMIPKWMIEAGYSPGNPSAIMGQEGPGMFSLPSPFQDVFAQTINPLVEGAKEGPTGISNFLIQQSNPALKIPYELHENKNTFLSRGGGEDVPIMRKGTRKEDLKNYFINQVPYARQLNRAFGGDKEKRNFGALASQLTGIYNQQLTPSIVKGELYRQEILASDRYADLKDQIVKDLKEAGVPPPKTESEWEDFLEAYAASQGRKYTRPTRKSKFKTVID